MCPCKGKGVEPSLPNPSGICMVCGAERFDIDPIAQEYYDRTGKFLLPGERA